MAPPHAPKVSIPIVCWNSADFRPRRLGALEAQTFRAFEVILPDGASTDHSTADLAAPFPGLRLILQRHSAKRGFPAAMYPRQKVRHAGSFDKEPFACRQDADLGCPLRLWVLTFLVPSAVLTHVGSNTIPQGCAFSISPGDGILIGASFKHMPRALLPYGPRSRAVHACLSSRCQPSC